MKPHLAGLVFLLGVFLTGCGKPKPSHSEVQTALQSELPKYLRVAEVDARFSPLVEIMGTTLPEGTWQIQVEAQIVTTELLYQLASIDSSSTDARLPASLRSDFDDLKQLFQQTPGYNSWNPTPQAALPVVRPVLVEVAKPGLQRKASLLMAATPLPNGWQIDLLEGDPRTLFKEGRVASAFGPTPLLHGSSEQRENFAQVRAELTRRIQRADTARRIEPQIAALNEKREALKRRQLDAARKVLADLGRRRLQVSAESNAEVSRILDLGTMKNDFRERDAPLRAHYAATEAKMEAIARERAAVEAELRKIEPRVDAEIDAEIRSVMAQAGLED